MILDLISLLGGLVLLLVAGDVLVRGSVGLALKLGVPPMITGLTVVAFGTSAPELLVSLDSALQGYGGIALGNVVGSNIANILLVLGLPSLFLATHCAEKGATKNALAMIAVTIVFISLTMRGTLGLGAGVVLLLLLLVFLYDQYRSAMAHRRERAEAAESGDLEVEEAPQSLWVAIGLTVAGLIGLPIGADFTVDGAVATARYLGVSDTTIGLTVIAIGTSLPELAATLMAAIRGRASVALGNVIGSNVFNLLAIIGITAVVVPIQVPKELIYFDFWVMLAAAILLAIFTKARWRIGKITGGAMTATYVGYIALVAYFGSGYAAMTAIMGGG